VQEALRDTPAREVIREPMLFMAVGMNQVQLLVELQALDG
jgi:hypothetical protein